MNRKIIFTRITFGLLFGFATATARNNQDFSFWNWYQLEYPLNKQQYVSVQFQYRLNNNASQFDKSNFYFSYGRHFGKSWDAECLYQFTTNYAEDSHSFYVGTTRRFKLRHSKLYYRMSVQHVRNNFTRHYAIDQPYTEFRNRLRISVPVSQSIDVSLSAEPYIKFTPIRAPYFSRIRNVLQVSYSLNKYQSISAFGMLEPEIVSWERPGVDEVIGLTWQITLPHKWKKFDKLFRVEHDNKKQMRDRFQ